MADFEVGDSDRILRCTSFFLDATPLLDDNWTGISVVCANISRQLLRRGLRLGFCLNETLLPTDAVCEALDRATGRYLARELSVGRLQTSEVLWSNDEISVGLSASVKRFNLLFDLECSWVHDISTLLQPEFHTTDNIIWHSERILEDLKSNHLTICISNSTRDDILEYLGLDREKLIVAHNGVDWPWWYSIKEQNDRVDGGPYLLVISTREPRKNLNLVFEMLSRFPELLEDYQVVIVGGDGWLIDQTAIPSDLISAVETGRILSTGFVSDYEKYRLLKRAEVTIFPSFFEGFGLPVLESLSLGTPCVASFSSSLPEVGGKFCRYFDPFSSISLYMALQQTLTASIDRKIFSFASSTWAAQFDWSTSMERVLTALKPGIKYLLDSRKTRPKS